MEYKYYVEVRFNGETIVETDLSEDYVEADKVFNELNNIYGALVKVILIQITYSDLRYIGEKALKVRTRNGVEEYE